MFLLLFLPLLLYSTYKYGYNNIHIQNFQIPTRIPLSQINQSIESLNTKYFLNLNLLKTPQITSQTPHFSHENSPTNTAIAITFSVTVTLSVSLMVLILCELIGIGNPTGFHLIIDTLVILLSIIIPYMISSLIFNNSLVPLKNSNFQKFATIVAYLGWFFLLQKIGSLANDFVADPMERSMIDIKINQVSLTGITINSILSGIGSCTVIYNAVLVLYTKTPQISEFEIASSIGGYNNVVALVDKRKRELEDCSITPGRVYTPDIVADSSKNRLGGLLHKVQSFASLNNMGGDEAELKTEIKNLEKMKGDTYNNLTRQITLFEATRRPKHITVKAMSVFNYGFAAYCIYRLVTIILFRIPHYLLSSNNEPDDEPRDALASTISRIILMITGASMVTVDQLDSVISFILSGSLFLLTFSNVLATLKSFGRFFPIIINLPVKVKGWLLNLVICQLLGIYVISTCLLIRTNLPSNLSLQISKILSLSGSIESNATLTREIVFIDYLFDLIFLLSNIITLALMYLKSLDTDVYDEEDMLEDAGYKTV